MKSPKTLALVGISIILFFMICGNAKTTQSNQKPNHQQRSANSNVKNTKVKEVTFEPKSALHGLTKDHFRFSSEIWEASDGVPIFLRREYCRSAANAEKALSEIVIPAYEILENRPITNQKLETTGRRIIATFDKEPPHQRVILWTDGEMLYSVESSSFEHALLFEKMFPNL